MNQSQFENELEQLLRNSENLNVEEVEVFSNPNERGFVVSLASGEVVVLSVNVV